MKRALTIFAALALLCSCEKEIPFKGDFDGEKLVLYATANTDSEMYAILGHSRFIIGKRPQDPSEESVTGARVTATVNGRTIAMSDDGSGVYLSGYTPKPGDAITISASHPKYSPVSASTVVPQKAAFTVDKVEINLEDEFQEEYYAYKSWKVVMRFTINDPAGEENFYRIRTYYRNGEYTTTAYLNTKDILYFNTSGIEGEIETIENAINGDTETFVPEFLDDSMINGESHTTEAWFLISRYVTNGILYGEDGPEDGEGPDIEPEFPEVEPLGPEDIWFEIDAVSPDLYKYCVSKDLFQESQYGLASFFGEAVSIHNNVDGGIGCVGAIAPSITYLAE